MNESIKKVLITGAFIFSTIACLLALFVLFKSSNQQYQSSPQVILGKSQPNMTPSQILSGLRGPEKWIEVQKKVKDTVIQIFAHVTEFNWLEPYKTPDQGEGAGSGFFINDKGDFITNYHVVAQASSIEIQIPSFGLERFDADIIGVCPERDIALLTLAKEARPKIIKQIKKIPYLKLGNSDLIVRSQEVLALGYPLSQTRLKSTLGIVSGRERPGYIQITAPLNPGNSGGPAIDADGNVVGINSRGVVEAQNVGYIIPINEVKSALHDLYKVKLLRKPMLGCVFTVTTPEMVAYLQNPGEGGHYIAKVFKNSLLDSIGVHDGDMLYEVNGHRIDIYGDIIVPWSEDKVSLFEFLNRLTIGDKISFVVYRKGQRKEFVFTFEPKFLAPVRMIYPEYEKNEIDYEIIGGMIVMQLTLNHVSILISRVTELIRYGRPEVQQEPAIVITNILPNSQAAKARILRIGQLLEEVNGDTIKTLADFRRAVLKSKQTGYITLRTEENFYAVFSLEKVIHEEDMLAARFFFKKSALLNQLASTPVSPKSISPKGISGKEATALTVKSNTHSGK